MQTITPTQLAQRLAALNHAAPFVLSAFINARARKTGNPFGDIFKLSRVWGFTGFDYEASVNRQQVREGNDAPDFQAQARKWGIRIAPCLVENAGKLYLVAKVQRCASPLYFAKQGGFWRWLARETVAPFLPEYKSAAIAQGVDKEVIYRNYALANLRQISVNGERYRVVSE